MNILRKCLAECIGTMVLVLVACGVAVLTGADFVATSLAFGLVIVAMAYSIGNVSGCHINPAVSIAMLVSKKISFKEFLYYVISQFVGAVLGALLLGLFLRGNFTSLGGNEIQNALLPVEETLLGNVPKTPDFASYACAFGIEVVLTFIFVIAILGVTDSKHHDGKHAGIVIGLVLTLVHLLGLSFTGTSVNPARSFGPALLQAFAGNTTSLSQIWIWIIAPLLGGVLAAVIYSLLTKKEQE